MYTRTFPRLAFVDLETTGGPVSQDRITEVGIIEVDESGVREWSSLVNPGMPIPPYIQSLTGISDDMVQDAPAFAEIADEIAARLADRVFIAHNARFDYGVLRREFHRAGIDFRAPVLCTVRLSRKLFPDYVRHNLDSLVERHALLLSERHRALGDARLIWQFWQKVHDAHAADLIDDTIAKLVSKPALPPRLDFLDVDAIPSSRGVYLFYGTNDQPLYVGRAQDLHQKIVAHFSGDRLSTREQELCRKVERVEWIETAGDTGALLHEATLINKLAPSYNRQARDDEAVCAWRLLQRHEKLQPVLAYTDDLFFAYDPGLYGLYSNPNKAIEALRAIAAARGLCLIMLGLEKARSVRPCSAYKTGQCQGACIGKESVESHNRRVVDALQSQHLQAWPYDGPIAVREEDMLHIIDGWAFLGSSRSPQETAAVLAKGRQRFDRDVYQILQKRLPKLVEHVEIL